jgi:hypothetical protein
MNPHKGEAAVSIDGQSYTLRYSHRALVKLETITGKGLVRILQEISNPEELRIGTIAALLWCGLQEHHPKLSLDEATDLLDVIENGALGAIELLGDPFRAAFNAPGTKATNPIQETNGTGTNVSSNTSPSATSLTNSGNLPRAS